MNPLVSAYSELESLQQQKAEVERKIEAVEKSIEILEPVYQPLPEGPIPFAGAFDIENLGITEAIEYVLRDAADTGLYPTQVRNHLVSGGFVVKGENPMASIHTVLKRLVEKGGSIVAVQDDAGKTAYKYDSSIRSATVPAPAATAKAEAIPPKVVSATGSAAGTSTAKGVGVSLRDLAGGRYRSGENKILPPPSGTEALKKAFLEGPNYIKGPEKK